jgi:hypothetical protein
MRIVSRRGGLVGRQGVWLVGDSISCAGVGIFWDGCVGVAGFLQALCVD